MDKQTITIYDVAREANVSMATVSRVVNGNPNVKPATRQKVLKVIEKLDYRPNAVARGLASKKTTTVGVVIPDITNIYFSTLARGIDDVATMYKYNIILANSDENSQKEVSTLDNLFAKQVDGLIYMGHNISDAVRAEFSRAKTPIVLAGSVDPDEQVASVNIDYKAAVKEAVALLLQKGAKKIAFVSSAMNQPINGEYRLSGYTEALADAKIPYDGNLVFETDYNFRAGEALWDKLQAVGADAAYVADDELSVGVLDGALDHGAKVPQDFQIITRNNTFLTEITRPQLSSISQPLYDIGAVAMRLLTKMMNKETVSEKTVLLPFTITERASTKK